MPYLCLQQEGHANLSKFLEKALQNSYSVVAAPINCIDMPLEFQREPMCQRQTQFTYPDLLLTADQWNGKVVVMLSDTIDCDSAHSDVRRHSEEVLRRDISWAEHLQYAGYMMLRLKSGRNHNLARIINNIKGLLVVQVPLYSAQVAKLAWRRDINEEDVQRLEDEEGDTWHWWNRFRWSLDFHPKVKVALEFNEAERPDPEVVRRWLGEPLEAVIIPSSLFIRNRYNYPVLPKAWQDVLIHFIRSHVNMIVTANNNDSNLKLYAEYLNNFRESHKDTHTLQNFEDVLEIPLQPLYDNLDCYTYEIFEVDPVKYKQYQTAITAALLDRVSDEEAEDKLSIIMVLGAGRGPLVRAALNAAENTNRKVRIYIIEKNPNAIRTLTNITKKLWHNKDIHIFSKDMREFEPPEKADILVSELLGSFGDNELSPECLDCAQKLLKSDGISIPCQSTSYINPLMSAKLYNGVRNIVRHENFSRERQSTYRSHAESGFVVLLKNVYHIDEPQALFTFVHPNRERPIDNSRYKVLRFDVKLDCVLHGVAGYFETVLYKEITLSINPNTHTPGMPSWFPMYFPFTEPKEVKKGQTIEIHFWRCVSKQKIWYEWCLAEPFCTHIHNQGGHSAPIYCT